MRLSRFLWWLVAAAVMAGGVAWLEARTRSAHAPPAAPASTAPVAPEPNPDPARPASPSRAPASGDRVG